MIPEVTASRPPGNPIYVGARNDLDLGVDACVGGCTNFSPRSGEKTSGFWLPLAIIDLPLSFALDTVLLPLTIPLYFYLHSDYRRKKIEAEQLEEEKAAGTESSK